MNQLRVIPGGKASRPPSRPIVFFTDELSSAERQKYQFLLDSYKELSPEHQEDITYTVLAYGEMEKTEGGKCTN